MIYRDNSDPQNAPLDRDDECDYQYDHEDDYIAYRESMIELKIERDNDKY